MNFELKANVCMKYFTQAGRLCYLDLIAQASGLCELNSHFPALAARTPLPGADLET